MFNSYLQTHGKEFFSSADGIDNVNTSDSPMTNNSTMEPLILEQFIHVTD